MISRIIARNYVNIFSTAWKVIKSRNKIGIYQLCLHTFSLITFPIDFVLYFIQNNIIKEIKKEPNYPVIFISGYARSGTTLLYQTLVNVWDVEYFNNLLVLFPRSYILVNYLYKKINKKKKFTTENYYGVTSGLSGTNDGPQIYYKWLNENDYLNRKIPTHKIEKKIKNFFSYYVHLFKSPLITKNCNNYLLFEEFSKIIPNSYFIYVKRQPEKIIKSVTKAREFIQGEGGREWEFSLKKIRDNGDKESPAEEICLNLKYSYNLMAALKQKIGERLFIIEYEEFCKNPTEIIDHLTEKIFKGNIKRLKMDISPVTISRGPSLNDSELKEIREIIERVFN